MINIGCNTLEDDSITIAIDMDGEGEDLVEEIAQIMEKLPNALKEKNYPLYIYLLGRLAISDSFDIELFGEKFVYKHRTEDANDD